MLNRVWFKDGQAPSPAYQSYYPMAQQGRSPYQPSPAAPTGSMQAQTSGNKPHSAGASQGHYGLPQGGYQTPSYDDNSYLGRYGESNKLGQQQAYQGGYSQNALGGNPTPPTSVPSASATRGPSQGQGQSQTGASDEDPYKSGLSGIGRTSSAASGAQAQYNNAGTNQGQQQQGNAQPQQQQYASYGYSSGYPQQNDWAQYAQYQRGGGQGGYWS